MGVERIINKIALNKLGFELRRLDTRVASIASLKPEKSVKGNMLISYVIDPFFMREEDLPTSHTRFWESLQIARTFLDKGYCVDVINFDNSDFVPEKKYDFFVGSRTNFQRIAELLNPECVKIAHLTVAHWLFNNTAQYVRLSALKKKKGVTIAPRKMVGVNYAIEYADYATILGNEFTLGTYNYADKQLFPIPISTPVIYPWPENKDFHACRNNFIWFGSDGLVHKGLDLVLEAFSEMPDMNLTVCGPVSAEKDFERVYYKELYNTSNIRTVGWVDIGAPAFAEITKNSIGLIYPSCSEGQSGGVLTCLHASLIPVVSYESGVSVDDFGIVLKQSSIAEIKNAVRAVSNLTTQQAKSMARKAWEYATANHTREAFSREYNKAISTIMGSN